MPIHTLPDNSQNYAEIEAAQEQDRREALAEAEAARGAAEGFAASQVQQAAQPVEGISRGELVAYLSSLGIDEPDEQIILKYEGRDRNSGAEWGDEWWKDVDKLKPGASVLGKQQIDAAAQEEADWEAEQHKAKEHYQLYEELPPGFAEKYQQRQAAQQQAQSRALPYDPKLELEKLLSKNIPDDPAKQAQYLARMRKYRADLEKRGQWTAGNSNRYDDH